MTGKLSDLIRGAGSFAIRVTPKASANRIKVETDEGGQSVIRVYVACVPEDGKANKAVIDLLAKELKIPKSSLAVIRGETSREKVISVSL